jgi:hypothetical protein
MNTNILTSTRRFSGISARFLLLFALASVVAGCSTLHASSDYDRTASFKHYKTYAWMQREHAGIASALVVRRAHEAIDWELQRKGFQPALDPATADFIVDFTIGIRDRIDVQSYPVAYRGPWLWGNWYYGKQLDVRQYREGTLAIDIFDAHEHQPVWSGRAQKQLSKSDLGATNTAIHEAATAVLEQFPPT